MGPFFETQCMCAYDCAQLSVHITAQNSSEDLPSYLQTTIIAQMLCIGGEGGARGGSHSSSCSCRSQEQKSTSVYPVCELSVFE